MPIEEGVEMVLARIKYYYRTADLQFIDIDIDKKAARLQPTARARPDVAVIMAN